MKYIEFKEKVMAAAVVNGLTEYELYAEEGSEMSVDILKDEIKSFTSGSATGACFRCIYEGKIGYASTELYTEEEAARIVKDAIENALIIEADEAAFIHAPGDDYETTEPVKTTEPSASELTDLAFQIQKACYAADPKIIDGTESSIGFTSSSIYLSNSKGLDLAYSSDYSMAFGMPVAREGEEMFDGFAFKAGDFAEFKAEAIANEAVEEALSKIGADSVPTGSYDVLFSNRMTAALISTFISIFSAESAQKGMSLLNGREGETIAAPCVTLTDDPLYQDSLVRIPFDSEGVATHSKHVIKEGTLQTLLHNLATAHKAGITSTGNGVKMGYAAPVSVSPYNFYLEKGGGGSTEDMFGALFDGIYITELNGMHAGANPVTGDFSLSSAGFLIEGGKKSRPIRNFTVSGNYYQLLKDVAVVGDDLELRPPRRGVCFGGPSILVKDMAIAGK